MDSKYYPYFRGKQFELITIRSSAELMATSGICPIIEPVKESLSGLQRAIDALHKVRAPFILIGNPKIGDHAHDILKSLKPVIDKAIADGVDFSLGIVVSSIPDDTSVQTLLESYRPKSISIIHRGMASPEVLRLIDEVGIEVREHVFTEGSSQIYRRGFKGHKRILIHDGFERRKNKDYPDTPEFFSELHLTCNEVGMNGFGDFLIVGDEFRESGGPAYAVAIHLTYFDPENQNVMMIRHFKSNRSETPSDPGGKYLEALDKLISFIDSKKPPILESSAIVEFRTHHAEKYFPGLGYAKRLSMTHHIETLSDYLMEEHD
ncbi:MAG TPA: sce7725 family protein [bacterium]|nr:sce7725 family protein [bacterium]